MLSWEAAQHSPHFRKSVSDPGSPLAQQAGLLRDGSQAVSPGPAAQGSRLALSMVSAEG